MNQATDKGNGIDLRPEWGIFIFRIGHHPDQHSSRPVPQGRRRSGRRHLPAFAANFGTLYLWITVGLIVLCVYFACSRYGDIKFGDRTRSRNSPCPHG